MFSLTASFSESLTDSHLLYMTAMILNDNFQLVVKILKHINLFYNSQTIRSILTLLIPAGPQLYIQNLSELSKPVLQILLGDRVVQPADVKPPHCAESTNPKSLQEQQTPAACSKHGHPDWCVRSSISYFSNKP